MYPTAYLDYIIYFHVDRDYFECHEVLEEHWKQQPVTTRQAHWIGLIQIAVGLYHHRRKNYTGALRMYNKAKQALALQSTAISNLGLDVVELENVLNKQIKLVKTPKEPFYDFNLPIKDSQLLDACLKRCEEVGRKWQILTSPVLNESLIHKHLKRNRKDVINERQRQLQLRQQKRQ
ncbi:DUF309 domain-containing protein [Alkalihalobacillus deserti]|uniref:DUF309 domain-containing protein n=1 Tax=Alkalihalobacillus deserti TaxID=2879466 RepID=UPI001D1529DA|nr:DUF309 domain-containing protein [Alkalihalobacillus deserti]